MRTAPGRSQLRIHLPLAKLALCVDCDACFEIGAACPACGSETWMPLGRVARGTAAPALDTDVHLPGVVDSNVSTLTLAEQRRQSPHGMWTLSSGRTVVNYDRYGS